MRKCGVKRRNKCDGRRVGVMVEEEMCRREKRKMMHRNESKVRKLVKKVDDNMRIIEKV